MGTLYLCSDIALNALLISCQTNHLQVELTGVGIYQVQREGFSVLAFFLFDFGVVLILKFVCSTQSTKVSLALKYFLKVHIQCLW